MEVKVLELRDAGTFIPIICIRPAPDNKAQCLLLMRGGYSGLPTEHCIIMTDAQCRGVSYDPYGWGGCRTRTTGHLYIEQHWSELSDGDVVDVQFILGETSERKQSESLA